MRVVYLLLLLLLSTACATWPLEGAAATPQRPTFSSDTNTTAKGSLEVEAGVAIDPADALDTPMAAKWGLEDRTEVFVGWSPWVHVEQPGADADSIGDTVLGLRHRVYEDGETSAAFQLATKLPTASRRKGVGSGDVDFFGAAIATRKVGPGSVTGFYQFGVRGEGGADDTDVEHGFALAGGAPVHDLVTGFAELALIWQPENDLESLFGTFGAAYTVNPSLIVDLALVVGVNSDAPDFQVLAGLTQNFGQLRR